MRREGLAAETERGIMNPFTKGKVGSRTGNATLNEGLVRNIRKLAAEGHTPKSMAEFYGLGTETIRKIIRRETWKWVSEVVDYDVPAVIPNSPALDAAAKASEERFKKMAEAQGIKIETTLAEVGQPPERRPPPSPLDGGDAPAETDGKTLQAMKEQARAYGATIEEVLGDNK